MVHFSRSLYELTFVGVFFRLFCIVFEAILQCEGVVVHSSRSLYLLTCVGVFFRLVCFSGYSA